MGALTETEIFDRLTSSFKLAAELCEDLAKTPVGGQTYDRFRKELRLIEGCCKQAAAWREDSRWLPIGVMMSQCHQKAGDWLRGLKLDDGTRVKIANGQLHPMFLKLAENLRGFAALAERTRTSATGRTGIILPDMLPGPHRDTVPVGYRAPPKVTPGGILLPESVH